MNWRADTNGQYWFVGTDLAVYLEADTYDEVDESRYKAGNYFSTRTEAVKTARWIYAGIGYIQGGHLDTVIERLLEARRIAEKVDVSRREP